MKSQLDYLTVGNKQIGGDSACFIIAEIGNNHNGDLQRAFKLVDLAVDAGADCVKFQMRNLAAVYRKKSLEKSGDDLSAEYTIDLLKKFELSAED
ncbi:MAG: N-acetylneuraminate synthase family protein, partial [Bdellovibrionaceae bacterium]|nr:N-acetylneuraminate synthase family protein [Pseudobdellovibrionaceae bacterium]